MKDFTKKTTVGIRVTSEERELFHELARLLKMPSYSSAVRSVVRETVVVLREKNIESFGSTTPPVSSA